MKIENEVDYDNALYRIEEIWDSTNETHKLTQEEYNEIKEIDDAVNDYLMHKDFEIYVEKFGVDFVKERLKTMENKCSEV